MSTRPQFNMPQMPGINRDWLTCMGWESRYIIDLPDGGARLNYDLLIADTREEKKAPNKKPVQEAKSLSPLKSEISLGEAIHRYLTDLQIVSRDEKRVAAHQLVLAQLLGYFGDFRRLESIGLHEMKRFLLSGSFQLFANGKEKPASVLYQSLRVIRHFMVWAYQQRYLRHLPMPKASLQLLATR